MSMEMKQSLKQTMQMVMTPQLQMAIKLLQVSRMELVEQVQEELKENPFLEDEIETDAEKLRDDRELGQREEMIGETERPVEVPLAKEHEDAKEVPTDGQQATDVDWQPFLENAATAPPMPSMREENDELPSAEQRLTRGTSLFDHLMQQLQRIVLTKEEAGCAGLIVGNLDADGYFKEPPLIEIAQEVGCDLSVAESALKKIQKLDPVGCGCRSLSECLLCQAEVLEIDDEVVRRMLTDCLGDFEKHNFTRIAQKLKVEVEEVYEAAREIKDKLEPRPGREFSTEPAQYVKPDVYIDKVGDGYIVRVNDDGLPKLKISGYYQDLLKSQNTKDKQAKEYVQERLRSAKWLIDSIEQRKRTIVKVTESILKFQRDFFEKGIAYLRPLILRDVANDIGMHESTISRATSNKYVLSPLGLHELKYFFNAGINREGGQDDIAAESVKRFIKQLCAAEDPKRPYSDQKLVELLKQKHQIDIARRTVAKYREQLNILPSAQRKRAF